MALNVILAGASGEVGKRILEELIANNLVTSVHLINRSLHPVQHPKVIQHQVNFEQLNTIENAPNFDLAYCCLGTTIKKAGSKTAFEKVDLHYVCQFAQLVKQHNCPTFAVISSIGAHPNKGGFYLETKGRMEESLRKMNWPSLYLFRPSLLIGKRQEFRLGEHLGALLGKLISPILQGTFHKYKPIEMDLVANAMASLTASAELGVTVVEGKDILNLARK